MVGGGEAYRICDVGGALWIRMGKNEGVVEKGNGEISLELSL